MKNLKIILLLILFPMLLLAQENTENISKSIRLEEEPGSVILIVSNINGNVTINPGTSNSVDFEIKKTIKAKSTERLQEGLEKTILHFDDRIDTIFVYIETPCQRFEHKSHQKRNWGYDWSGDECHEKWQFNFDIDIEVPESVNLYISTVNNGDISIQGVRGSIFAHNINGSVAIDKASGKLDLYTINGDLTINYQNQPTSASSFYTLNGDINSYFPQGLSADMTFKSFNGDFFTNIDDIEYKPVVLKEDTSKKNGVAYKVGTKSIIQSRSGGVLLDFETFNGNVYVKEKTN